MNRIKAPEGKVLKGYLFDHHPFQRVIRRILVNEFGLVFVPGNGWSDLQPIYKIICLPTPVDLGNDWKNRSWDWDGWWEKNWGCDSWAWCYMATLPKFTPSYILDGAYYAI
jgi:hypothetical protein